MSDDDKKFFVVEFPPSLEEAEDDSSLPKVEIVPRNWILSDTKECWWPTGMKNESSVRNAIANCMEPNQKFEKSHYSKILRQYKTFKEARERVKRALDESEWESSNTESFLPQSRLGRKVKKPSKFVNGAEVSDTERHGGNVKTSQSQKSSKSKAREKYLPVKAPPPVPLCPPSDPSDTPVDSAVPLEPGTYVRSPFKSPPSKSTPILNPNKSSAEKTPAKSPAPTVSSKITNSNAHCRNLNFSDGFDILGDTALNNAWVLPKVGNLSEPVVNHRASSADSRMSQESQRGPRAKARPIITSDTDSDKSSLGSGNSRGSKDNLSSIKRKRSDSSSSRSSGSDEASSSIKSNGGLSDEEENSNSGSQRDHESPTHVSRKRRYSGSGSESDKSESDRRPLPHNLHQHSDHDSDNYDENNHFDSGRGSAMSSSSATGRPSPSLPSSASKNTALEILKDLLQTATRIEERQKVMAEDNQEMLQRLRNKGKVLERPRGMPKLPLLSEQHLEAMEKCLKKHSNFEYLVLKLAQESGTNISDFTDNALHALMVRSVYSKYSLRGKTSRQGVEPKKTFTDLQVYQVLKGAGLHRFPNADPTLVDASISDYLRYSPFRSDRRERKKNSQRDDGGASSTREHSRSDSRECNKNSQRGDGGASSRREHSSSHSDKNQKRSGGKERGRHEREVNGERARR